MKSSRQDSLLFKMAALCPTFFIFLSIPLRCTKNLPITFSPLTHALSYSSQTGCNSSTFFIGIMVRCHFFAATQTTNKQTSPASKRDHRSQLECNLSNPVICRSKGRSSLLLRSASTCSAPRVTTKKEEFG